MPTRTERNLSRRRGDHITDQVSKFRDLLEEMVDRAQRRTFILLQEMLDIRDGVVVISPHNQQVLRRIDKIFLTEMRGLGYNSLLNAFVEQFPGQVPMFRDTLKMISDELKTPLPRLQFRARDTRMIVTQQASAKAMLETVVESAALAAKQEALLSVGGMPYRDLVEAMASRYRKTIGQSETLATTSISTYWRTLNARAFEQMEGRIEGKVYYRYTGPDDILTRPFCQRLVRRNRTYTRQQVERMDNRQLPNPFLTGGGYNCRHAWVVDHIKPRRRQGNGKPFDAGSDR